MEVSALRILRLGGVNPTTSRFLDLLEFPDIEHIDFIIPEAEGLFVKEIFEVAKFFDSEDMLSKVTFNHFNDSSNIKKAIKKGGCLLRSTLIIKIIYSQLKKYKGQKYDFIWIGDNDFDGSNAIFIAARNIFKDTPIIRSYKETRFERKWEELKMLIGSDHIIFPSSEYRNFFYDLYDIKIDNYSVADLDWRYSKSIKWAKSLKVEKLSSRDMSPHVCILTGKALCDPRDKRSGFRYYFVPLIKELVERGINVHLHAIKIVESASFSENPYRQLVESTGRLFIEGPLRLVAGSRDYEILKRYDAGILHPPIPNEFEKLKRFQEINIPNRIYEYQIADVLPITERGSTEAVEKMIENTGFGIVFSSYDELSERLFELVSKRDKILIEKEKIGTFRDFSEVLLNSIMRGA